MPGCLFYQRPNNAIMRKTYETPKNHIPKPFFRIKKFSETSILIAAILLLSSCGRDEKPNRTLNFEDIGFIEGRALPQATGFIGSRELDALYIVSRETNESFNFTERVIKYDLSSGDQEISNIEQFPDWISKNAHLLNNDLIVVGGTRVNVYPMDLASSPSSALHGLDLSRFGSAVYEEDLYVWGGDLNELTSNQIRRWNFEENTFETIGEFPTPVSWAHGEIVKGRLYTFGGQEQFANTPTTDKIYSYNLQTDEIETYFLPELMSRTFTARFKNKIYVAGHVADEFGEIRSMLGIFNTDTKKFTSFEYASTYEPEVSHISQMAVVGNRLYILTGTLNANIGLSLQVANL